MFDNLYFHIVLPLALRDFVRLCDYNSIAWWLCHHGKKMTSRSGLNFELWTLNFLTAQFYPVLKKHSFHWEAWFSATWIATVLRQWQLINRWLFGFSPKCCFSEKFLFFTLNTLPYEKTITLIRRHVYCCSAANGAGKHQRGWFATRFLCYAWSKINHQRIFASQDDHWADERHHYSTGGTSCLY